MKKLTKKEKQNQEYIEKEFEMLISMLGLYDKSIDCTFNFIRKGVEESYDLSTIDGLKNYYLTYCVNEAKKQDESAGKGLWFDIQENRIQEFLRPILEYPTFDAEQTIVSLFADAIRHDIELEEQKPY